MTRQWAESSGPRRAGFVMAEAMVALLIFVLALGAGLWIFLNLNRTILRQKRDNEMQQNLLTCLDALTRDIRMGGYGLDLRHGTVEEWIDWVSGVTGVVHVVDGGASPDALTIVAALDDPIGELTQPTTRDDTSIEVTAATAAALDTAALSVIYIGQTETARVESLAGTTVTISTHPTHSGHGLRFEYPAGTQIERVDAVTYSCIPDPGGFPDRPFLVRNDNQGTITNNIFMITALDIDDLQVERHSRRTDLTLRVRALGPELGYTHPTEGDGYRRKELSTSIVGRNL